MKVPERLTGFRVYLDGDDLIGVADVTLPSLEAKTETVKGAGIAGEVDSPVVSHYGSMEVQLNWRTLEKSNILLASPKGVHRTTRQPLLRLLSVCQLTIFKNCLQLILEISLHQ